MVNFNDNLARQTSVHLCSDNMNFKSDMRMAEKMFRAIIINHSVKLDLFWPLKMMINSSLKVLVEIAERLYVVLILSEVRHESNL